MVVLILLPLILLVRIHNNNSPEGAHRQLLLQSTPRVVNGYEAPANRFPYFVSVMGENDNFVCAGAVIASNLVVTAAHCDGYVLNCAG